MYHIVKSFQRVKARNREGPGGEGLGVLNYKILVKNSEEACAGERGGFLGWKGDGCCSCCCCCCCCCVLCSVTEFFFFLCINSFFFSFFFFHHNLGNFYFYFLLRASPPLERERGRDQTPFFLFPFSFSLFLLSRYSSTTLPSFPLSPPPPKKKILVLVLVLGASED